MINIINNIVDISKIESGAVNIKIQKTHLNQILNYLYDFFKMKCSKKGIEINYSGDLDDNECIIDTDKDKLIDSLTNLIDNALKYTNSGTINFGYHCVGDTIEFYVSDTGIGIAKEKQSVIFERFVQADSSLTREYEGAGLGLSIAKSYIEMLDGRIWVESKLNAGSTFFFTLPFKKSGNYEPEINSPQRLSNSLQPINILIAEDDLLCIQYFKEIFSEEKVNLFFANNGKRAVEIVHEIPEINLVLMDIKMPIMDGNEATRQIKKIKPKLPIISQTAHAMSGDREKLEMVGCDDYIVKPIQEDLLFEIINKYITN
jgi:CheY-like chemotaxis protein